MGVYFLFDIAFVFALQYRKIVYMMESNNDYEKQCFVVYKNLLFLLVAFFTMWSGSVKAQPGPGSGGGQPGPGADHCIPDPYAAQQTWWLPYGFENPTEVVRIDFQSGGAVLNNPSNGTFWQGLSPQFSIGYEGNTTVTNPVTGEFLFATDGNSVYRASYGAKATGIGIGGDPSSGESAAVIPDPQGILGRDFIVFGNSANTSSIGKLNMGKYNLDTNAVLGVTTLLNNTLATGIAEALEVIPQRNGTDYWIVVYSASEYVRVYEYNAAGGFNPTPVSELSVPSLMDPTRMINTFISWIPQQEDKILITRHNRVGLVDFDRTTGQISNFDGIITQPSPTYDYDGYSAALSPNGEYLYYAVYASAESKTYYKYYDLTTATSTDFAILDSFRGGMKVGPDGRLYFTNSLPSEEQRLYYISDADNPPANTTSYNIFNTGGRSVSVQLPNSAYWACDLTVCQAGDDAPDLDISSINSLPATAGDLVSLISVTNQPANTVMTVHTDMPATDANKLEATDPLVLEQTYYIAFWDEFYECYSPAALINLPFGCTGQFYMSSGNPTQFYVFDSSVNPFTHSPVGANSGILYNAIAKNPIDGKMYGMRYSGGFYNHIIEIHTDGTYTSLGAVANLPDVAYNSGEIDSDGNYYVKPTGLINILQKINLTTLTATEITLSSNLSMSDLAYNPVTGLLYTVSASDGRLYSIDPDTGIVTPIGSAYSFDTVGAMFGAGTGEIFGAINGGGLYQFNITTGERVLIANSPTSNNNDGARCVTAPLVYEADLYTHKTDNTTTYFPGTTTTYTVVVGNNGPFGVLNAEVEDLVPAGIPAANVSYTAVASAGSSTTVSGTQTGAINDLVSLPVGGTVTYTVTVTIPASFTGDLVNTVTVTPPLNIDDVDMSNNTATDTDIPEPIPFECDGNGTIYTIKSAVTGTQLYMLDYSTSPYTEIAIGDASHGIQYHAIGYNRDDNFLYALSLPHTGAEAHKLYRIGNNGVPVELGVIAGLDTSGGTGGWISGGFAEDGKFFVKRAILGADIYVIDINAVAIDMIIPASAYDTGDVTFANGKFYFLSRSASTMGRLISIDYAAPHTITELPYVNSSIPGGNHGGMFSTASGKVLGIDNNGKVYHYNLTTGQATQIGTIGNWVQAGYDATSCLGDFDTYCTQPGLNGTPTVFTHIGISDREGLAPNWPAAIPNGFIAIESENKGFVITRIQNDALITEPEEGMLIYDMDAACVKLYYDDEWHCLERSCNE